MVILLIILAAVFGLALLPQMWVKSVLISAMRSNAAISQARAVSSRAISSTAWDSSA